MSTKLSKTRRLNRWMREANVELAVHLEEIEYEATTLTGSGDYTLEPWWIALGAQKIALLGNSMSSASWYDEYSLRYACGDIHRILYDGTLVLHIDRSVDLIKGPNDEEYTYYIKGRPTLGYNSIPRAPYKSICINCNKEIDEGWIQPYSGIVWCNGCVDASAVDFE